MQGRRFRLAGRAGGERNADPEIGGQITQSRSCISLCLGRSIDIVDGCGNGAQELVILREESAHLLCMECEMCFLSSGSGRSWA